MKLFEKNLNNVDFFDRVGRPVNASIRFQAGPLSLGLLGHSPWLYLEHN